MAEKAKDVAEPGSPAAASSGTGPSGPAAEKAKDVAVPGSSAAASSGPGTSLVSYTGVPLPKQRTAPPASALENIRVATQVESDLQGRRPRLQDHLHNLDLEAGVAGAP